MGEEPLENVEASRGEEAADAAVNSAADKPSSGYVTTDVAAAALRLSPRSVREYIRAGELEAMSEGEGVQKRWLVSIDSVQALREQRRASGIFPDARRDNAASDLLAAESAASSADLIAAVQELQYRLGRAEARAELQAVAESTLRESLDRERQRADTLELEAKRLRGELENARRSWWRRWFGF